MDVSRKKGVAKGIRTSVYWVKALFLTPIHKEKLGTGKCSANPTVGVAGIKLGVLYTHTFTWSAN